MGDAFLHHMSRVTSAVIDAVNPEEFPIQSVIALNSVNVVSEHSISQNTYDLVIVAVSLVGFDWAVNCLKSVKCDNVFILTKGLLVRKNNIVTLSEYASKISSIDNAKFYQVAGPCIAEDLKHNSSALELTIAGPDAKEIAPIISQGTIQFKPSLDRLGVSWAAAFKNIYAIAIGSSVSKSEQAALLTRILNELSKIISTLGGEASTAYQLAGLGDLWVTASGGRNGMFGKLYQQTGSLSQALSSMQGKTIEGIELANTIREPWIFSNMGVNFPIANEWIMKLKE